MTSVVAKHELLSSSVVPSAVILFCSNNLKGKLLKLGTAFGSSQSVLVGIGLHKESVSSHGLPETAPKYLLHLGLTWRRVVRKGRLEVVVSDL